MGGYQVPGSGSGDDGYDEEGYDESQRAEILEATRNGPSDGTVLIDLDPDLGAEDDEPDEDDLNLSGEEIGEEADDDESDADDDDEDDAQAGFEAGDGDADDDALPDADDAALRP